LLERERTTMLRRKAGFTLIELLVVIAIVAVLAAILYPVLVKAKINAIRSACSNNLRQIGIAFQSYAGDYSGKVPPACVPSGTSSKDYMYPIGPYWYNRLIRYMKSDKLLVCPETTPELQQYFLSSSPVSTYGMNWRFANGGASGGSPDRPVAQSLGCTQLLDAPPIPTRTVLLIETQNKVQWLGEPADQPKINGTILQGGNVSPFADTGPWAWAIRWYDLPFAPWGHDGGCNVAMADSHVVFVRGPGPPYPPDGSLIERAGLRWW
jgi:prepilin-type N-terminal cleavage/methylation domain-containing protein/prepilin-type processing-associated H-X9-DG protein